MYTVIEKSINGRDSIVLENSSATIIARICLSEGGRIVEWNDGGMKVIGEPSNQGYNSSYAAAVLVPFVNRIDKGGYSFQGQTYQLKCNENERNAIHGLVYNCYFQLKDIQKQRDSVEISLEHVCQSPFEGFPFLFKTVLIYTFADNQLSVEIQVENIGKVDLPFNLGWHPYCFIGNNQDAKLEFSARHSFDTDEFGITCKSNYLGRKLVLNLSEPLDNAFSLNGNTAAVKTNERIIELQFPKGDNYLQVYTPADKEYVAIEPMTGISNSFNNSIGLQILKPTKSISKKWILHIKSN